MLTTGNLAGRINYVGWCDSLKQISQTRTATTTATTLEMFVTKLSPLEVSVTSAIGRKEVCDERRVRGWRQVGES